MLLVSVLVSEVELKLSNIDIGTANRPAKNRQNYDKNIQKKFISDLPTLIFSRYETGTTGIFLRLTSDPKI
jgi:hypothetical protein